MIFDGFKLVTRSVICLDTLEEARLKFKTQGTFQTVSERKNKALNIIEEFKLKIINS